MSERIRRGLRISILALAANVLLGTIKLIAGLVGHSYALVADAVESFADCISSIIVWGGLRIAARPPDATHPYGHGKAESLAALACGLMLLGASGGIAVKAIDEIVEPAGPPEAFTLFILLIVVAVKETLFRIGYRVGSEIESTAIRVDSWHHRSDAITSAIAGVGIAVSVFGGSRFAAADGWAALAASGVIAFNGFRFMRAAMSELMDEQPSESFMQRVHTTAGGVAGVLGVEKVLARKVGTAYLVDMHIEVDEWLAVRDAHELAHRVKDTILSEIPSISDVLIHVEPHRT
jgi:cation diffusion facilitator family transporter